jgi:hypothetical protein
VRSVKQNVSFVELSHKEAQEIIGHKEAQETQGGWKFMLYVLLCG